MSDEKVDGDKTPDNQESGGGSVPPTPDKNVYEKLIKLMEVAPNIRKMLGEIDAQKLDVKSRLEHLNDMFAVELKPLVVEGKVLSAEDEEIKKTMAEFIVSLEKLYLEEVSKETPITKELIDRADREYDLGKDTDRLDKGEKLEGPEAMARVLEGQNWGKIFTSLKEKDRVLSWAVPGADFLSIKYLNDKVFGPQETNKIIKEKRDLIEKEMENKFRANVERIQSDYKIEMFRVVESSTGVQVTEDELNLVAAAVDKEMTTFVSKLADDLIVEEKLALKSLLEKKEKDGLDDVLEKEIKKHEEKISLLAQFNNDLHGQSENSNGKKGFRMTWGLSEPIPEPTKDGGSAEGKLLGLTQSLQINRMSRKNQEGESYGAEYKRENILTELKEIKNKRDEIIEGGNKITDKDGNEFKIFKLKAKKWVLNREVLRDVRKGKFEVGDVNKKVLEAVSLYVKRLNILDAVKPFTFTELEKTAKDAEEIKELAYKIKVGENLSKAERGRAVELLRSEEKDDKYTSKSEFNKKAIDMEECAYVSLDVLDLGVDQLLEYENLLQDEDFNKAKTDEEKMEKFSELALKAGDETTKKLRDFRKDVAEICEEFGFKDGLIVEEVGGDELTLAINTDKDNGGMNEETLDKLLFALKEKTNTRVIKTVVAKSEKDVSEETDHEKKVEAHLQALKRAEAGAAIAKDIEVAVRKLNLLLKKQGENVVKEKIGALRGLFVLENGQVKSSVVVVEKDGVFKIGKFKIANEKESEEYQALNYEFDYETIHNELDSLLNKNTSVESA